MTKRIQLFDSFTSLNDDKSSKDVEHFLHDKAVQFEKVDLSRTYLVMSTYRNEPYLAGYFAISNKSLVIPKQVYKKLSGTFQKKLMGMGHKTEVQNYECKGYLIGQLGKNYSVEARNANQLSGEELLELAYEKILEAHEIVGGKVVYLECEHVEKLKNFYKRNGFREMEEYDSPNNLCIFVKTIKKL